MTGSDLHQSQCLLYFYVAKLLLVFSKITSFDTTELSQSILFAAKNIFEMTLPLQTTL